MISLNDGTASTPDGRRPAGVSGVDAVMRGSLILGHGART